MSYWIVLKLRMHGALLQLPAGLYFVTLKKRAKFSFNFSSIIYNLKTVEDYPQK
jgi:hypothetical protein